MPDGRAIEPKPILGISSDGMLCSASELGLGDDHSGILILPAGTPLGVPYGEALGLGEEVVYDLDVLRNRPDCYGHLGVARDVAAKLGARVLAAPTLPALSPQHAVGARSSSSPAIAARGSPPSSSAASPSTESPDWMRRRLAAAGMRPINNVVDVSNYVMLETNQPNHAYDFDTLGGGGFRVRLANEGEVLVTLDDVARTLTADDLLICDATDRPIGLAGIMGGQNTEISDATTTIALEIRVVRAGGDHAQRGPLGPAQRGVGPLRARRRPVRHRPRHRPLRRAAARSPARTWWCTRAWSTRAASTCPAPPQIVVRPARVSGAAGHRVRRRRDHRALIEPIGFGVPPDGDDLEVHGAVVAARLHAWRSTSSRRSLATTATTGSARPCRSARCPAASARCSSAGVGCATCCSASGSAKPCRTRSSPPTSSSKAGLPAEAVRLANPLAVGDDILRTSLRPGLLKAIAFNESHRRPGVALFEIGHVYPPSDDVLPAEYEALGVVLAGADAHGGGGRLARARGGDGLGCSPRPGQRARRPAHRALGHAVARQGRRSAPSARSTPTSPTRSTSPSASRCSS